MFITEWFTVGGTNLCAPCCTDDSHGPFAQTFDLYFTISE